MSIVNDIKPLGFHWEMYDPFLFCAHHKDNYPKGNENLGLDPEHLLGRPKGNDFVLKDGFRMYHGDSIPGFPVHPHRGFETITITLEGLIDHADSLGGSGRYGEGDVQWMTAGKGIQHTEMFPLLKKDERNKLELLQIWINLPKRSKFVEAYYKMLWHEDLPIIELLKDDDICGTIRIIAGDFGSTKALPPTPDSWASDPQNEVAIWLIHLEPNSEVSLPQASAETTRALYNYRGEALSIDGTEVPNRHQARLDPSYTGTIANGNRATDFLIVQGKAINEPIAQYGPFVMNTRSEIQEAYIDYSETRFGGWPWDTNDPVHGTKVRRFAILPDGSEEIK